MPLTDTTNKWTRPFVRSDGVWQYADIKTRRYVSRCLIPSQKATGGLSVPAYTNDWQPKPLSINHGGASLAVAAAAVAPAVKMAFSFDSRVSSSASVLAYSLRWLRLNTVTYCCSLNCWPAFTISRSISYTQQQMRQILIIITIITIIIHFTSLNCHRKWTLHNILHVRLISEKKIFSLKISQSESSVLKTLAHLKRNMCNALHVQKMVCDTMVLMR